MMLFDLIGEFLLWVVFELVGKAIVRFAAKVRKAYYRIRYPNKYLRAKKLAAKADGIHTGTKAAGWILAITIMLLLLLLFYKLTGVFD